jgi:hypothetical protein
MADVFSELTEPVERRADKAGHIAKAGILVSPQTAGSSLSLAVRAARIGDPALDSKILFLEIEDEDAPLPAPLTVEDHELAQAKSALASHYLLHEQIAESLGPDTPDIFQRYVAACRVEGIGQLRELKDYTRWRNP